MEAKIVKKIVRGMVTVPGQNGTYARFSTARQLPEFYARKRDNVREKRRSARVRPGRPGKKKLGRGQGAEGGGLPARPAREARRARITSRVA